MTAMRGQVAVIGATIVGQLDLNPPPSPPHVPLHFVGAQRDALIDGANRLETALRAANDRQRPLLGASRTLRRDAATLLDRASRHGLACVADEASVAALRLTGRTAQIDDLLRTILADAATADDATMTMLESIADAAPLPTDEAEEGDGGRAFLDRLSALVEVAMRVRGQPLHLPWPVVGDDATARRPEPRDPDPVPAPQEASTLAAMSVAALSRLVEPGEPMLASLDRIDAEALASVAADPRNAVASMTRRQTLAILVGAAESIAPLPWLDRNDRARLLLLGARVLDRVGDAGRSRDDLADAREVAEGLRATADLLLAMERLRTVDAGRFRRVVSIARTLRRVDDPDRLLPQPGAAVDESRPSGDGRVGKHLMTQFVRRMTDTSAEQVRPSSAAIADALRGVLRERRRVEDALMVTIDEIADRDDAATDPRLTAMLAAQRQLHDDLRRLTDYAALAPRIALLDATREDGVRRQLEKLVRWLRDPNRRPDAERAARELDRQVRSFAALPGERALADGGLDSLAGASESGALLDAVAAAREGWSSEWAIGNGCGPSTSLLWRWHRLMTVAVAVHLGRDDQRHGAWLATEGAALGRWPDWIVPRRAVRIAAEAAVVRLRAAVAAVQRGDPQPERGADPLRVAERSGAIPALELAIAAAIAPAAPTPRDGHDTTLTALAPLVGAPNEAVLAVHRPPLLQLGLAALEHAAAGNDDDAARLAEFALAMADDLVNRIAPPHRAPPTLLGFDGSDPEGRR